MMINFFERKLFFGAAAPSAPSAYGASVSSSTFFAFAIRPCPDAQNERRVPCVLCGQARWRMVNDCLPGRKKLPGDKHIATVPAGHSAWRFSLK
jgi:hypothetical protein